MKIYRYITQFCSASIVLSSFLVGWASAFPEAEPIDPFYAYPAAMPDSTKSTKPKESSKPKVKSPNSLKDRNGDFIQGKNNDPYYLSDPQNIVQTVEYDSKTNMYILTEKIGEKYYRPPTYMTYEEYASYSLKKSNQKYWKDRNDAVNLLEKKGLSSPVTYKNPSQEISLAKAVLQLSRKEA
ncbi:MAG: hypothetical protein IPK03_12655 [Bacteroidetes bacterium]|nr:hypothetical protein [Bacteroidota bacterium]